MSIFKCKMCGGTLEIKDGMSVVECEYCGIMQTIPKLDDDRRINLYDRANHFRRNNDFDKAMSIYEQILNDDKTDAEAYWSLVLCRYGIEYVEDPTSHKRVPTVNRAQYTSVFMDEDYKSAIKYADAAQKIIYEKEAKAIDKIQKSILEISQKEEPFDVFICYKEADNNGRRTPDSVLANDLYHELIEEGFKVFYSRITLEDKLGTAYEPYIFAALNSAKVMVVLGTKAEYFNAVWVRNEWSRYLALIKNGAKKMLIPAYKDMDPYDLPDEFSHLQAQDMSKLGFMQDLIRGIKKILAEDEKPPVKETVVVNNNNSHNYLNTAPLLERVFLFLEDGDWKSADEYCEKVLDIEPKNAQAYLGKLMAEKKVSNRNELVDLQESFDNSNNYIKIIRFGDDKIKSELQGYIKTINDRNENIRRQRIYDIALSYIEDAETEDDYLNAAEKFKSISGFEDSDKLAEQCLEKAEIARKDKIYDDAMYYSNSLNPRQIERSIKLLESIADWKDANEMIGKAKERLEEINAAEERKRLDKEKQEEEKRIAAEKRQKRIRVTFIIMVVIAVIAVAFAIIWTTFIIPESKYNEAVEQLNSEEYEAAYKIFNELGDYKDSEAQAKALELMWQKEGVWSANVGDIVKFGSYEQDNDKSNGKEEIEWEVLDKQDNKLLVISKYCLDCQPYNTKYEDVTWENCSLREWLNNTFLDTAFSDVKKAMIPSVTIANDDNYPYYTNPGNDTTDKIFLLSIDEANKYFTSYDQRQVNTTAYAMSQGASCKTSWWLRSAGYNNRYATYILSEGQISNYGSNVSNDYIAVRPAMWISLE